MIDIADLKPWVGRKTSASDQITLAQARKLAATLDHTVLPEQGDVLAPLWHWIYFTPETQQSDLGADGHPRLGSFMPPIPLPRRMLAGGRLQFLQPIRIGDEVTRETEILSIEHKSGRQGELMFVTLSHRLFTGQGLSISEEQDIVYRQPELPKTGTKAAAKFVELSVADWRESFEPDPVLLFRYSALTFNSHRIHYDQPYAGKEEAYPGLVMQGPLTATLLADRLAARTSARLAAFTFRGQQPLFSGERLHLCGQSGDAGHHELWAETPVGTKAMVATAQAEDLDNDQFHANMLAPILNHRNPESGT